MIGASCAAERWAAALHSVVAAVRAATVSGSGRVHRWIVGCPAAAAGGHVGFGDCKRSSRGQKGADGDADREFFQALFAQALKTATDQPSRSKSAALRSACWPMPMRPWWASRCWRWSIRTSRRSCSRRRRALKNLEAPAIASRLLDAERFRVYSPPCARRCWRPCYPSRRLQAALLSALESGAIPVGMVDSLRRRQLTRHRDPAVRERAEKVFAASAVGNRAGVYEDYKSVVGLTGHPENGRRCLPRSCANCHRLDREGTPVGPDLFGIRSQPKEAILLHILIPEFEITPGFGAYMIETTDGRILAGLLVGETANQVTLRAALGREETVLRSDIESLSLSKLSLMPQELEKTMSRQEMADLLAYLKGESP